MIERLIALPVVPGRTMTCALPLTLPWSCPPLGFAREAIMLVRA
jgi:hypothetical protein